MLIDVLNLLYMVGGLKNEKLTADVNATAAIYAKNLESLKNLVR
jgi:hypothetical protein